MAMFFQRRANRYFLRPMGAWARHGRFQAAWCWHTAILVGLCLSHAALAQQAIITPTIAPSPLLLSPIQNTAPITSPLGTPNVPVPEDPLPFGGTTPPAPPTLPSAPSSAEPVYIQADEMFYDHQQSRVIARGHVEVAQGEMLVWAQQISYHQPTDVVTAQGDVKMLQPDGSVYFADHLEFKRELREGVIQNFRVRMKDNSLFAAREGEKINQDVTLLRQSVYSPCKICKTGNEAPLWQFKSKETKIDQKEQQISYKNAFVEVYGVPVLYTPYFSHATPDADAKAGFLTPQYRRDVNLGLMVRTPYYIPLASNKEITLTPIVSENEGMVLAGQYRYLGEKGYGEIEASGTYPERLDAQGNPIDGRDFRGHLRGFGRYDLNENWLLGFDVSRTTDDTYLWKYRFSFDDTLMNRTFAERIEGRSYIRAETVSFQGLQATDNNDLAAMALPWVQAGYESDAGWMGSRWFIDSNMLMVDRDIGTNSRRASVRGGWRLPMVTDSGQLLQLQTSLRLDGYDINDFTVNNQPFDGQRARAIPQAEISWRYPLQNTLGSISWVVEPTAAMAFSPHDPNDVYIPNEDSRVNEFTDINLFTTNHFTGNDLIETGLRGFYGLRNLFHLSSGLNVDAVIGQNFQQNPEDNFPFTNSREENFSDYVGRLATNAGWLDLAYQFRLDQKDLAIRRSEVSGTASFDRLSLGVNYVFLDQDILLNDRNDIVGGAALRVTENWTISAQGRGDLDQSRLLSSEIGLTYMNECVAWFVGAQREFTFDRDVRAGTNFTTRLMLRNVN